MPQQVVGLVWLGDGMLLIDAFPHIGTGGLSYLYPSREGCVVVHVDLRDSTAIVGEDLAYCLHIGMFLSTILRLSACMVLISLCACRLSEAMYAAAIIIILYSIGRIILSIKAISSSSKPYFLYNISSVHGWEKSCIGTN